MGPFEPVLDTDDIGESITEPYWLSLEDTDIYPETLREKVVDVFVTDRVSMTTDDVGLEHTH